MSSMYGHYYTGQVAAMPPSMPPVLPLRDRNCTLIVRQQPKDALVSVEGKEKCRKPIDPPPIVELKVNNPSDVGQQWLQSPYFFIVVDLIENGISKQREGTATGPLTGTLTSSLHRLKDNDNSERGFFIFGDISAVIQGTYQLRFNLFELQEDALMAVFLGSVDSEEFNVVAAKDFKGMAESTVLSRSFSDQGVRLRLRKEPRGLSGNKRKHDASAVDEMDKSQRANMASDPSSYDDETSSPTKRFKHDSDDRKDSLPTSSHSNIVSSAYSNPSSYTPHSSYAAPSQSLSRHNTLPDPSSAAIHNFNVNIGMQSNYPRTAVPVQQQYQQRPPMTNTAGLYSQQMYHASAQGTMQNGLPHLSSYSNSNNIFQYVQPRNAPPEPMSYPAYPDNNDYGGHSQFPHSQ